MLLFFITFVLRGHKFIGIFGEMMPYLNVYLREEAPLNWVSSGRGRRSFLFMFKIMLDVGRSFILCSMIYPEGWSFRSSYFIGVA